MPSRAFPSTLAAGIALVALLGATASAAEAERMTLTSPDFADGQPIPPQFSCEGPGTSPELRWSNVPPAAKSLALVVRDPDAPGAGFVHWIVYDLPATAPGLPQATEAAGALPTGAVEGANSKGATGWVPPCPPGGAAHHYQFELYALDTQLPPMTTPTEPALYSAMRGHILARADLVGTYQKSR
jgi:Raf kinase inhibitor-like YbhB/YbcL family protein